MDTFDRSFSNAKKLNTPSILSLKFPFTLKDDQLVAVESWVDNGYRGTILYSTGTGKTEIAFECAKRMIMTYPYFASMNSSIITNSTGRSELTSKIDDIPSLVDQGANKPFVSEKEDQKSFSFSFFNILILVPRISLIDQTINRLISYGIPKESIGSYFGERKEKKEIIVSTYNSVVRNPILIRRSNMVILDEVHLIKDSSKSFVKLFDYVIEDPNKGLLGLTATLDERDQKNSTIMAVVPPIIRYPIKMAVKDKRLAKPVIIPVKVSLTGEEREEYQNYTTKIKNISNRFKRYDASSMTNLLKKGGFASGMAKAWFSNVRKRKLLLSYADNKLSAAVDIIEKKFPDEKIMVFSETIESIQELKRILLEKGIKSMIIDAKVRSSERQRILDKWGTTFNVLLSVHTLEIGYDVPQVRIEIILATTSNINQIVQRIGRVLRKYEDKSIALIYVVYIPDTKDDNVIDSVAKAVSPTEERPSVREIKNSQDRNFQEIVTKGRIIDETPEPIKKHDNSYNKRNRNEVDILNKKAIRLLKSRSNDDNQVKRINKAFQIVEHTLKEKSIIKGLDVDYLNKETNGHVSKGKKLEKNSRIYKVKSTVDDSKTYIIDLEKKSCTCADYQFRRLKCKHILAIEFTIVDN
ncbi:helicase-related protein [Candidatus Nitrosocosmicus franklandus]|uniref:UvrABC system protein B n=1 Tax=Candidatus Nitrosocosmicus franklandianus TaxID=1798806 RepID=A0A484IGX6_9ARCH|nr:helicase-related protein [Candidatus Nitrosocosmicus franklandus]VFJ15282.1 UvrABC system protein B [Candidatus Nitrosocosmicus franklandus]